MGTHKTKKKNQQKNKAEQSPKIQRLMMFVTMGAVFVSSVLVIFHTATVSGAKADPTVNANVFQYEQHPDLGSMNAPVKIVEFADFKCPACKRFDETIFPQLQKDFVDTGTVQFTFINDPIISPEADSVTAAIAGEAVYHQNTSEFWKFYQSVYANQGDETTNWATSDTLIQIAKQSHLSLDYTKLKKDIVDNTYLQNVKNDETIANQLGVDSTPTLYINGKQVSADDTFTYSALKDAILKAKGETKE